MLLLWPQHESYLVDTAVREGGREDKGEKRGQKRKGEGKKRVREVGGQGKGRMYM